MLDVVAVTDPGAKRTINEDHFIVDQAMGFFAVCDGMGGHAGGEVASRLACEHMQRFVQATRSGYSGPLPFVVNPAWPPEVNRLSMAVRVANQAIHLAARENPALVGMGTTCTAALVHENIAHLAHVGDSRAYLFRQSKLFLLTRDHSSANELVDLGLMTPHEAAHHPEKNVITRALGVEPDVEVTLRSEPLTYGDLLLLCTDGLTDLVRDDEIAGTLHMAVGASGLVDHETAARNLVQMANWYGGKDNITIVAVRYG